MMWLDVGIIFLLMIAVGFCYRLSDRLQSLKGFTTVLAPSIERLTQVLNGANQAIGYLKQATETSQKGIETYIWGAHRNDLKLIAMRENQSLYLDSNTAKSVDGFDVESPEKMNYINLKLHQTI